MSRLTLRLRIPLKVTGAYEDVVYHKRDFAVIPTRLGRVFFCHSLADGRPNSQVLRIFASKLRRGEVDKLIVCDPQNLARGGWGWTLRYHLFANCVGTVSTGGEPSQRPVNGTVEIVLSAKMR
jgi:hypothetical protein